MTKAQKKNLKNYHGVNPRKAKKQKQSTRCPVCGASIKMMKASEMNFRYLPKGNEDALYWCCSCYPHCDTYIKADPRTKQMDGLMGGATLRHKRITIHRWEMLLSEAGIMNKASFRYMCGSQIGLHNPNVVHTRYMTEMECDSILGYLKRLYDNRKEIHDLVEANPNSVVWKEVRGLNTQANHGVIYNEDGTVRSTPAEEDTP